MPDAPDTKAKSAPGEELESVEGGAEVTEDKKSGLVPMLIKFGIIGAVAIVAVIGAYFVTAKVVKPMLAHDGNSTEQVSAEDANHEEAAAKSEEGGEEGGSGKNDALYEIDNIVVNPASTIGSRFLSCSIAFELTSPGDYSTLESNDIKIRDALITILSARTVDELSDARLREPLRKQIQAKINRIVEPVEVSAVYFKDFVLQ